MPCKGVTQSCIFQNTGLSEGQFLGTVFGSRIFLGSEAFFSLLAEGFPAGKERRETHKRLGDSAVPWRRVHAAPGCRLLPQGGSLSRGHPPEGLRSG